MTLYANRDALRDSASVLQWWHDAGVDVIVGDEAMDWLTQTGVESALATEAEAPADSAPATAPLALPTTIEAFGEWRNGAHAPDAGWPGRAITAAGPAASPALMVLVDCPERTDRDALLEGIEGRLLDRMLAAIGLSRDAVLLAAVCVRRPPGGRVPRDVAARLNEAALHHVSLVRPRRLLLLGDAASRAIAGTGVAESRGHLRDVYHKDQTITHAVASWHPRNLLDRPALKAEAWKDLLMLDAGNDLGTQA